MGSKGFLYFLPGETRNLDTVADMATVGLGYIAQDNGQIQRRGVTGSGPSGTPGLLIADPHLMPISDIRYLATDRSQCWRKIQSCFRGDAEIWIGHYPDSPPDLARLQRPDGIPGERVSLDDGQSIEFPQAKQYVDFDAGDQKMIWRLRLPTSLDIDDDGNEIGGSVVRRYATLWDLATQYETAVAKVTNAAEEDRDRLAVELWPKSTELRLVDRLLKTNYRFGLAELTAIGLYDVSVRDRAFSIMLDDDGFARLQKKMLAILATGDTSLGPSDLKPRETPAERP